MPDALGQALRAVARKSGWAVKRDMLSRAEGGVNLAVHPIRGEYGRIGFFAKPELWDRTLWSILQIVGNEAQPTSFRFTGWFICSVPPLVAEGLDPAARPEDHAAQMLALARRCLAERALWDGYDLDAAIAGETPSRAYSYHITRVVARICAGDRDGARAICTAARAGTLDVRRWMESADEQGWTGAVAPGLVRFVDFFELAPLWMQRN